MCQRDHVHVTSPRQQCTQNLCAHGQSAHHPPQPEPMRRATTRNEADRGPLPPTHPPLLPHPPFLANAAQPHARSQHRFGEARAQPAGCTKAEAGGPCAACERQRRTALLARLCAARARQRPVARARTRLCANSVWRRTSRWRPRRLRFGSKRLDWGRRLAPTPTPRPIAGRYIRSDGRSESPAPTPDKTERLRQRCWRGSRRCGPIDLPWTIRLTNMGGGGTEPRVGSNLITKFRGPELWTSGCRAPTLRPPAKRNLRELTAGRERTRQGLSGYTTASSV